jgi:methionine synthase II (cobalamin-independent)
VDLDVLAPAAYDEIAGLLEQERPVHLGVVPSTEPASPPSDRAVTERVLRLLDMLGLDPQAARSLVVTPSCGLASATDDWARRALALCRTVAGNLT